MPASWPTVTIGISISHSTLLNRRDSELNLAPRRMVLIEDKVTIPSTKQGTATHPTLFGPLPKWLTPECLSQHDREHLLVGNNALENDRLVFRDRHLTNA